MLKHFFSQAKLANCVVFIFAFISFCPLPSLAKNSFDQLWFPGSMQDALTLAQKHKKPLLVYWGAVWCPPCNELKAHIFSHPDFAAITAPMIRVFLNGDQDEAQSWGEKLHASGYPTILLLSPEGKEFLRIANSLSWDEFKQTLASALAAQGTFAEALNQALESKTTPHATWQLLAFSQWPPSASPENQVKDLLARERLIDRIPSEFAAEKALLIAGLVDAASASDRLHSQEAMQLWKRVETNAYNYLSYLVSQKASAWASRDALIYNAENNLKWAQKILNADQFAQLGLHWIRSAEFIRTRQKASTELKLAALRPHLILSRMNSAPKQKTFEPPMKKAVAEAVHQADREAQSSFERHSVISTAASLLEEIGEINASRQLLTKELQKTDTPWYYQSSLAHLENKAGNTQDALKWSHLAKESARGNATRLQWITSDLLLNMQLAPDNSFKINKLLREYYDLAFSLKDGFKGRNARRAEQVKLATQAYSRKKDLAQTMQFYVKRCPSSPAEAHKTCEQLFAFK